MVNQSEIENSKEPENLNDYNYRFSADIHLHKSDDMTFNHIPLIRNRHKSSMLPLGNKLMGPDKKKVLAKAAAARFQLSNKDGESGSEFSEDECVQIYFDMLVEEEMM